MPQLDESVANQIAEYYMNVLVMQSRLTRCRADLHQLSEALALRLGSGLQKHCSEYSMIVFFICRTTFGSKLLESVLYLYFIAEMLLYALKSLHIFTSSFSGQILASLHFPAERKTAADILAPCVSDKQNFRTHLMPYLALESSDIRAHVAAVVAS